MPKPLRTEGNFGLMITDALHEGEIDETISTRAKRRMALPPRGAPGSATINTAGSGSGSSPIMTLADCSERVSRIRQVKSGGQSWQSVLALMVSVALDGLYLRLAQRPSEFDVVAINDLADPKHLAVLLKYDSVHGRFRGTVEAAEQSLIVDGKVIRITSERDPANLPWKKLDCQIALESNGLLHEPSQLAEASRRRRREGRSERTGEGRARCHACSRRQRSASSIPSFASCPTPRARPTVWRRWPRS